MNAPTHQRTNASRTIADETLYGEPIRYCRDCTWCVPRPDNNPDWMYCIAGEPPRRPATWPTRSRSHRACKDFEPRDTMQSSIVNNRSSMAGGPACG